MIQIYEPPPIQLLSVAVGAASAPVAGVTYTLPFRVPTPDSRLMVSIALLFTQIVPQTVPWDATIGGALVHSLWLAAREYDIGGQGAAIPTGNLVGTRAAPLVIPSDVSIDGYSDDFTGGQDELYGEYYYLEPAGGAPGSGFRATLYVRYQPVSCAICDEEWSAIVRSLTPQAVAQLVFK